MGAYDVPFWSPKFYDHKARWLHYFTQIRAIAKMISLEDGKMPFEVLEVGPSHGLVTSYLKKFGVSVKTLDIKKEYGPDILCSVTDIKCENNSFDAVLACEVLEHLTWDEFKKSLKEIHRVTKKYAFISVPNVMHTALFISAKLPFLRQFTIFKKVSTKESMPKLSQGAHQWEIGRPGMSSKKVKQEMEKAGFLVVDEFVNYDTPKNHCFFLKKYEK